MSVARLRWLDELLRAQGAPYVWGGHGTVLWTPQGMVAHPWGGDVYDCAGLVTTTLYRAGGGAGPDWRATHNAQTLWDVCQPVPDAHRGRALDLLFYGASARAVSHVAVIAGCAACEPQVLLVLEASGGGRGTVEPQRNPRGPARVSIRRENRSDFLGERSLPAEVLSPLY